MTRAGRQILPIRTVGDADDEWLRMLTAQIPDLFFPVSASQILTPMPHEGQLRAVRTEGQSPDQADVLILFPARAQGAKDPLRTTSSRSPCPRP